MSDNPYGNPLNPVILFKIPFLLEAMIFMK